MVKPISQREAAKRHIECAIRLIKTDDLEAHTLAYAAYGLLRELLGRARHWTQHSNWRRS
jgi:hypothetical protein